jgi:DNA-binding transcriptional LysR family regulator
VGRAVGILSRQSPGFRIDLSVSDWPVIIRKLLNSDLDVGIAEISETGADDRLDIEPLPRHPGVVFVRHGHPLARRRGLTIDHVREFPLVLTQIPTRLEALVRRRTAHGRHARGPPPFDPEIRVDTFAVLREIVTSGDAVGVGLRSQIRSDLRARRLVILPLDLPWLTTNYGIIRLAGRTASPLLVDFLNILRRVEDDIAVG